MHIVLGKSSERIKMRIKNGFTYAENGEHLNTISKFLLKKTTISYVNYVVLNLLFYLEIIKYELGNF